MRCVQADEVIVNAFRTYDPAGTVELEDREKLVLMRNYIRDYHAKMQTTIALWQSENAERMAGDMIAGDMTAYFTLSQRVTAYRKPIGGVEGGEGLDYPPPPGVTNHVEGSTHPSPKPGLPTQPAPVAAATSAGSSRSCPASRSGPSGG